jgi:hypothetical protein
MSSLFPATNILHGGSYTTRKERIMPKPNLRTRTFGIGTRPHPRRNPPQLDAMKQADYQSLIPPDAGQLPQGTFSAGMNVEYLAENFRAGPHRPGRMQTPRLALMLYDEGLAERRRRRQTGREHPKTAS